ncbi:mechanosensitive ion channel domain-containing protein [Dyadobacter psychrotolerans]|uniref:Mechanosensitive ion channel n=1 Tax=Dyadobacter psychrotolerans TaxID=2541721 RepID=A0A4R5DM57_9BACT|nr:mechanosensitive ion channel domain-containing protein [Dyadobacter psychrotolerans]TDE15352.1 mechanosensitive ion channel [Dyadobacter psychrotolerans]
MIFTVISRAKFYLSPVRKLHVASFFAACFILNFDHCMRDIKIPKTFHFYISILVLLQVFIFSYNSAQAQNDSVKTGPVKVIPDTLLFRLEKVQAELTQINASNKKGYNSEKFRKNLAQARTNLDQISEAIKVSNPLPASKDLLNYRIMLTDLQKNSSEWRNALAKSNSDLQRMSDEIIAFSSDSLLSVVNDDTTQRTLYASQITDLKQRLQKSGETTVANLDSVSRLLAEASAIYFTSTDLQNTVNDYLEDSDQNVLGQEADFLWNSPVTDKSQKIAKMIKVTYSGQDKILRYFFNSTWDNRVLLILLVAGFFAWVFYNYRQIKRPALATLAGPLDFKLISPRPVLACLVVLFTLTPLFEPHSPSIYIELNQFLQLITLTFLFHKQLDKHRMKWWLILVLLYVTVIFFNVIVNESLILRSGLIVLSCASIYVGIRFYRRADTIGLDPKHIRPVLVIHIILTALSVLLNIFGRLSLAKSFNITGISGVIQVISLAMFIQIVSEALELHIKVSSCSGGVFSKINVTKSRNSLQRGLTFISVWLWVLVFLINLNILDSVGRFISQILDKERTVGNLNFTLANIVFFSVIIYAANLLQKNIGLLFGEGDVDFSNNKVQRGSKLALIRLLVFVIGFLFATTVSGVPLDKITVLLGALGVGIGLGLQNIINNFVSGIILIFEKPFSIGDYIELADKKGRVLDIGIRSSKMLTPQGSRVIIPNGDLLSGRLVNYTTHDSHLKSEIILKVNQDADLNLVKKLINETVDSSEGIVKKAPKQILFNGLTADSVELKILVWITDVYAEPNFRSYFLEQLLQKFKANGVKIM